MHYEDICIEYFGQENSRGILPNLSLERVREICAIFERHTQIYFLDYFIGFWSSFPGPSVSRSVAKI
jgi:hypothetical protein